MFELLKVSIKSIISWEYIWQQCLPGLFQIMFPKFGHCIHDKCTSTRSYEDCPSPGVYKVLHSFSKRRTTWYIVCWKLSLENKHLFLPIECLSIKNSYCDHRNFDKPPAYRHERTILTTNNCWANFSIVSVMDVPAFRNASTASECVTSSKSKSFI
jgi:hypothetical protein